MATYAIGDVQGCLRSLDALLARVGFEAGRDRLWMAGDLVNRGPDSLGVLRRLRALGPAVTVVLGNHDLHLLGRAAGARAARKGDTLERILAAADREVLIDWLRRQPLMHVEGGWALFHAGLLPEWSVDEARGWAVEAEARLAGPKWRGFLEELGGKLPASWAEAGRGGRLRLTVAALTRLRMVDRKGRPEFGFKGPPAEAPRGLVPWYAARDDGPDAPRLVFGHWAALGFARLRVGFALDSGCVWGGALTAIRLDDGAVFRQPALDRGAAGRG